MIIQIIPYSCLFQKQRTFVFPEFKFEFCQDLDSFCVDKGINEIYKEVFLDHPFIFAIVHNGSGIPIFVENVNHLDNAVAYSKRN